MKRLVFYVWTLVVILSVVVYLDWQQDSDEYLCLTLAGEMFVEGRELSKAKQYIFAVTPDNREVYINRAVVIECTEMFKRPEPKSEPQSLREET